MRMHRGTNVRSEEASVSRQTLIMPLCLWTFRFWIVGTVDVDKEGLSQEQKVPELELLAVGAQPLSAGTGRSLSETVSDDGSRRFGIQNPPHTFEPQVDSRAKPMNTGVVLRGLIKAATWWKSALRTVPGACPSATTS